MSTTETKVKERPILFSGPMVRAILEGRKTQTRRIVNLDRAYHDCGRHEIMEWRNQNGFWFGLYEWNTVASLQCPYGNVGERLWVRETWAVVPKVSDDGPKHKAKGDGTGATWRADWNGNPSGFPWKPSIHMPRWASRINLEITGVRVERLNDISEADAYSEGVTIPSHYKFASNGRPNDRNEARVTFETLWESINGPESWPLNPWVWVVEFKRIGDL